MRHHPLLLLVSWLAFGIGAALPASAQQHRATRLGLPAFRFARPIQTTDDLRALFRDPKVRPDIASVLQQAGWTGDPEDLYRAAASADIYAVKIPTGTRLPFMSTRRNGRPVALIDVLWAGKEPISAYEFEFVSGTHRYRCITPKLCANFLVADLGPVAAVVLSRSAATEAVLCEPFEIGLTVRNSGGMPLTGVRILDPLPACWVPVEGARPEFIDAGSLAPGEAKAFRLRVRALQAGACEGTSRVISDQGAQTLATGSTVVRAPALSLVCAAPPTVLYTRPARVCLTVRNTGDAPEPRVTVTLPLPAGAALGEVSGGGTVTDGRLVWEMTGLAPGTDRTVCATFTLRDPGAIPVAATASGTCSPPVESRCETRVEGIPAILLEVVDLEDPVEVGKPVVYEIRVTNQGTAALTQVKPVCHVPESQEYVSGDGVTPVLAADGRTVTLSPLARLEPKAEVVWRVTTRATGQADARFQVDLTTDQFLRAVEEIEATSQY